MATIINNPPSQSNDSGGSMGMIIGLVILVVLGILFFQYGLPAIQNMSSGGVQINVPSELDVTVNQEE